MSLGGMTLFPSNSSLPLTPVNEIGKDNYALLEWYTTCNAVCTKLGVGILHCNSIPRNLCTKQQIESFVQALVENCAPWRALKLVTLGNGRIGKTTLLHKLRSMLDHSYKPEEVCNTTLQCVQ